MWVGARLIGGAIAVMGSMASSDAAMVQVEAGQPARLCLATGDAGLPGASGGRRRAVLAIHEIRGDPGALAVRADTGEDMLIGLFPGGAFTATAPDQVRRSFLPGQPSSRCWDVELTGEGGASVTLELSEPLD